MSRDGNRKFGQTEGQIMEATSRSLNASYELRFKSLHQQGRGWVFPCDPNGNVDLDHMSERARNNYFFARALMGREVAFPSVQAVE